MTVSPADGATPGPDRYRALDYTAYYAGDDFQLIDAPVTGVRQVLPAIAEPLLKACKQFRTLEAHAAAICQIAPFREVPPEAVHELLTGLVAADLLVSHRDLAARLARQAGEHRPATITAIGIPTGNRPDGLRRVVETTAEHLARHGRRVRYFVADDSDEDRQAANLGNLHDLIERFGIEVWYAGPREKAAFAERLAAHCAVPLQTVQVALGHPAGWPSAPGPNRNAFLLHGVGEALLTLDDDMVCRIARLPECDDGLALTSSGDPTQCWYYPSREATIQSSQFVDDDFLALHEAVLGKNVGRLAAEWPGDAPLDLDHLASHFLKNQVPDGGAVTYTMAGVLGDSGLKESLPFFFADGPTLDRLLGVEGGHRAAMASRQMARGVLRRTISDTEFCMGANIGLDNRELLPPFQTAARNEDGIFSSLVRRCIPGSFIGFLPRTILHDPVVPREYAIDRFEEHVGVMEASEALPLLIWSWPEPPGRSTVRRRHISLGQHLIELGSLPPADFEERLREVWLTLFSSEATYIEHALKQYRPPQPESWPADLRRYLDALVARLEADPPITVREREHESPGEARAALQAFLRDFGGLLCAWPDLVEGARELRARGERLGRRL